MEKYTFYPLAFRMKYINRWGLMRNITSENLLEHSAHCAMLAHSLALIGNRYFSKNDDAGEIAVKALYHDLSEIYTGDLPTPVKYFNKDISTSYKDIEKNACSKLLSKLPPELKPSYESALDHESDQQAYMIVKSADKLCALIKCMEETKNGNLEFSEALASTKASLEKAADKCPELKFFMQHFLPPFESSLDRL